MEHHHVDHGHHHHADHDMSASRSDAGHPMHHHPTAEAEAEPEMQMGHHMMMMFFHGGVNEIVLFDWWRVSTVGGLIASCVVCFLLAILYEGLKFLRDLVYNRNVEVAESASSTETSEVEIGGNPTYASTVDKKQKRKKRIMTWIKTIETNMWSRLHLLQTLRHFIQVCLSYALMLVVMTFNTWLCLSTVFGLTVGYFLFGWRKTVVLQQSEKEETCH